MWRRRSRAAEVSGHVRCVAWRPLVACNLTCSVPGAVNAHVGSVTCVRWSPLCDDLLATCSFDQTLRVWDARMCRDRCGVRRLCRARDERSNKGMRRAHAVVLIAQMYTVEGAWQPRDRGRASHSRTCKADCIPPRWPRSEPLTMMRHGFDSAQLAWHPVHEEMIATVGQQRESGERVAGGRRGWQRDERVPVIRYLHASPSPSLSHHARCNDLPIECPAKAP